MVCFAFLLVLLALLHHQVFVDANSDFNELLQKWSASCEHQNVPFKNDGSDFQSHIVPWSMKSEQIKAFIYKNKTEHCKIIHELTQTIAQPVANYSCHIPFLNIQHICSLIDQYSMIFWYGDSLTRHMTQAFHMLIKQDLHHGGYPPQINHTEKPYNYCSCDGQFAESWVCMGYKAEFSFTDITTEPFNACPHLKNKYPKTEFISILEKIKYDIPVDNLFIQAKRQTKSTKTSNESISNDKLNQCSDDPRPIYFYIQGGPHYDINPHDYINGFLRPLMQQILVFSEECYQQSGERKLRYKIYFGISGPPSSSPETIKRFPNQDDAHITTFYNELNLFIQTEFPYATLLNFQMLTKEGIKSDGFHSFSDVNIMKTMIVLYNMKLQLLN